jgi:hypothetical protein
MSQLSVSAYVEFGCWGATEQNAELAFRPVAPHTLKRYAPQTSCPFTFALYGAASGNDRCLAIRAHDPCSVQSKAAVDDQLRAGNVARILRE